MSRTWLLVGLLGLSACSAPMQRPPELLLTLTPNKVTDATPVLVKVSAATSDGKNGTGTVRVTSVRGSLINGVDLPLDEYGTARTELVCDPVTDVNCLQPVRVVAEWTVGGEVVSAEARLNGGTAGAGGGAGGGGGTGSGGGSGGTSTLVRNACATANPNFLDYGAPLACCSATSSAYGPSCPTLVLGNGYRTVLNFVSAAGATVMVPMTANVPSLPAGCTTLTTYGVSFEVPTGFSAVTVTGTDGVVTSAGTWLANASYSFGGEGALTPRECGSLVDQSNRAYLVWLKSLTLRETASSTVYTYTPTGIEPRQFVVFITR